MNDLQQGGPIVWGCGLILWVCAASSPAQMVGGNWAEIHLSGAAADDRFGSALQAAGDVNGDGFGDVIVGAYSAGPGGLLYAGSAYVYSGLDGSLLHQFHGSAEYDYFGSAVAGAGDVNADGYADLLIGAPGTSPGGFESAGSAFLYSGLDGSLLQQYDGSAYHDRFGSALAGVGDSNGDGYDDYLISAPLANPGDLESAGSVMLYSGLHSLVMRQFDGQAVNEQLGTALAECGDVDLDGIADFIIASSEASPGLEELAGMAQVYSGASGALLWQFEGSAGGQRFAWSVAGAGDVNADGYADLLFGSPYADKLGAPQAGMAQAYSGLDGSLLYQIDGYYKNDNLGMSVAGGPDFNSDGYADLIIGASRTDTSGNLDSGSVLLVSGIDGSLLRQFNGKFGTNYGYTVANLGDTDGNSSDDFAVGAWKAQENGFNRAGSVDLIAYTRCLTSSGESISASAGGSASFMMDFPTSEAGLNYYLLGSATGTGPITSGNVEIPLNKDWMFNMMTSAPPPQFSNVSGLLDAFGDATATLTLLPDEAVIYAGTRFYFAGISYSPPAKARIATIAVILDIEA